MSSVRRSELGRVSSIKTTFRHGLWKKVDRVGNATTSSSSSSRERPKLGGMDDQRVFRRPSPRGPCRVIVYPPSHPIGPELGDALMPADAPHTTADGSHLIINNRRRQTRLAERATDDKDRRGRGRTRRMVSDLFTIGPDRQSGQCNAFVGLLTIFFPSDGRRDPLKAFIARVGVELFLFASDLRETDGPQQKEWQKMI
ncbi:hypothetical protein niasHS_005656 [Heterodera schachtii]|uniref:Uncharacterized protein n=1 Tax=Heterodera schachtii TaxID=97005 RepID=A0ABD2JZ29_HETSC